MEKEIIWSSPSRKDLRKIYEFNSLVIGEAKAFQLIEVFLERVENLRKSAVNSGTRFRSKKYPGRKYYKLVEGHHIIIYRQSLRVIYINRIFDTRQNPDKLKV